MRQAKTRPLIAALKSWLRGKLALISQKSKLAEAIRYALPRWDGLTRFVDDGRIEINSNVVERSIRSITLNRKNALFAGHKSRSRDNLAVFHKESCEPRLNRARETLREAGLRFIDASPIKPGPRVALSAPTASLAPHVLS